MPDCLVRQKTEKHTIFLCTLLFDVYIAIDKQIAFEWN